MKLVVYTTVFGRTDPLFDPTVIGDCRYVCFTDQPVKSNRWEIVRVPTLERPKRECRKLKQPSHRTFPEADATLWVDASFEMRIDPMRLLEEYTGEIIAFKHDKRTRITEECEAIIRGKKAKPDAVRAQLAAYKELGWDTDENPQRLISHGGFLLRHHTPAVIRFNELWHEEVQTRTLRDQMSIDYCAYLAGVTIQHYLGTVKLNPYVKIRSSMMPTNDF